MCAAGGMLAAAAASVGASASALWHYNRKNFLYDRKLRQEQEFAIFEWRKVQAELWREDVRDIIEMTEKKMDNYLIVSVLQLGMCAGLFACGRLEPGTPPWLLQFYMLALAGAFLYLLMSVWLAMHAGVVAQCASVRMLTQFVRLPVPGWHDFEGARTYAHAFESIRLEDALRVPFTPSLAKGDQPAGASIPQSAAGPGYEEWNQDPRVAMSSKMKASSSADSTPPAPSFADADRSRTPHADPWRLERHGLDRGFYELQKVSLEMRRHIRLARRAALQFQCFDAFARVAMGFGTHQLLFALAYYSLGYLAVQDGVIWAAACTVAITTGISGMMMHVDFTMTCCERFIGAALVIVGQSSSCFAVILFVLKGAAADDILAKVLPVTYIANFLWLLNALRACGIEEEPMTGVVLPMKFRTVLYLDVFGWLSKSPAERCTPVARPWPRADMNSESSTAMEPQMEPSPRSSPGDGKANGRRPWWRRVFGRRRQEEEKRKVVPVYESVPSASSFTDIHTDHALFSSIVGEAAARRHGEPMGCPEMECHGPGGEIARPPEHAFEPTTWDAYEEEEFRQNNAGQDIVTGQDRLRPSKMPGKLFRSGTLLLAFMWAAAFSVPFELLGIFIARPAVADIYIDGVHGDGDLVTEKEVHAVIGTDVTGLPELRPIVTQKTQMRGLGESQRLRVNWPTHSAFVPRAFAVDADGRHVVVADDLALYTGEVQEVMLEDEGADAASPTALPEKVLSLRFEPAATCVALEGVAILDVSATCASASECDAFVLSGRGRNITRCPLRRPQSRGLLDVQKAPGEIAWEVEQDWLEGGEQVRSLAVRRDCWGSGGVTKDECIMVGTSTGRIVDLFAADFRGGGGTLVPTRTLVDYKHTFTSGSLAALSRQVTLSLCFRTGVVSAVDGSGESLGAWQLPAHSHWLIVSSGGGHIFVLGVRKTPQPRRRRSSKQPGQRRVLVELHRFAMPQELRAALDLEAMEDRRQP